MRFDTLVEMADQVMHAQVHHQERLPPSTARPRPSCPSRSSATTAPACTPTNRSGRSGDPLFCDEQRLRAASATWRATYIGGLLKHAPALLALRQPDHQQLQAPGARLRGADQARLHARATARRLRPHPDVQPAAPRHAGSSSARPTRRATRTCLLRHADGRARRHPEQDRAAGEPLDKDIYDLDAEDCEDASRTPGSLDESLDALEADHDFLLRGGVFTPDVIDTWIWYKRDHEVDASRCGRIPTSSPSTTTPELSAQH